MNKSYTTSPLEPITNFGELRKQTGKISFSNTIKSLIEIITNFTVGNTECHRENK